MDPNASRTRRQMIVSTVGLVGAGVFGMSRLGRLVPAPIGSDEFGLAGAANATEAARRIPPSTTTTTTTTTTTIPLPEGALAFPVDPTGGLLVLDNFGGYSVAQQGCTHKGIDIFPRYDAEPGRPLLACTDGELDWRILDGPQGNAWVLEDANGDIYRYHHLESFADGLEPGSTVVRGQLIGYMGSSGNAGSPHVHFEVRRGGTGGPAEDPIPLLPLPIPDVAVVKPNDGCP